MKAENESLHTWLSSSISVSPLLLCSWETISLLLFRNWSVNMVLIDHYVHKKVPTDHHRFGIAVSEADLRTLLQGIRTEVPFDLHLLK